MNATNRTPPRKGRGGRKGGKKMVRRKRTLEVVRAEGEEKPGRRNRVNFFELAYQKIEDLLVNCELRPGQFLTMLELQHLTGFGRTPIHHAVNRLSADTLIII